MLRRDTDIVISIYLYVRFVPMFPCKKFTIKYLFRPKNYSSKSLELRYKNPYQLVTCVVVSHLCGLHTSLCYLANKTRVNKGTPSWQV